MKIDITEITSKMCELEGKFHKECKKVDVLHQPECNSHFISAFMRVYYYWKTYNDTINGNPECKYLNPDIILNGLIMEIEECEALLENNKSK